MQPLQLEARGLIFDATNRPPAERVASFTSLCALSSGTILAGFQLGSAKHALNSTIRLCRSRDEGSTWHELPYRFDTTFNGVPGSLAAGELVEYPQGKLFLFTSWVDRSEPKRPFLDPVSEGILHTKQLIAVSTDQGETWRGWREVPIPGGLTGCAITGPPLIWRSGAVAYAFESFKEFDDPRPGRHGAWLLVSHDGVNTFDELVPVAQHPDHKLYYWDQRLCPGDVNGEYFGLFWTHDLEHKKDLHVHFRRGSLAEPPGPHVPTATTIPGQIAAPLHLADGRLLAFVVDRGRPGTMKLWQSRDDGATWPAELALTVYTHDERAALTQGADNIDFVQYWEDMGKWTFGHPALRPVSGGRVLLAYYAGAPGCLSIHWARVKI
jgi:hypothetical protein